MIQCRRIITLASKIDKDFELEQIENYLDEIEKIENPFDIYKNSTVEVNDSSDFFKGKRDHGIDRIYERGVSVHLSAETQKKIDEILIKINGRDSILINPIEQGKTFHYICPDGNIALFRKEGLYMKNVTVLAASMGIPKNAQTSLMDELAKQKKALDKYRKELIERKKIIK